MRLKSLLVLAAAVSVTAAEERSEPPDALKGPRAIIVYGEPLRERVVLHGERTTARFLAAAPYAPPEASPPPPAPDRPSLRLALFWGPGDPLFPVPKDSADLVGLAWLRLELADRHGRFFPARGREPAVVVFEPAARPAYGGPGARSFRDDTRRPVLQDGLELLAERGVPTRVPAR